MFQLCCLMVFCIIGYSLKAQTICQNRALDFDGVNDLIQLNGPPVNGTTAFTTEMWFTSTSTSTNTNCFGNFRRLFSFVGPNNFIEFGECGQVLNFRWRTSTGSLATTPIGAPTLTLNNWYHLAMVYDGSQISIYLDCILIFTTPVTGTFNFNRFRVGQWQGALALNQNWLGQIDEVRLWSDTLSLQEITEGKTCPPTGQETNLALLWRLDQGIPQGNNGTITQVIDHSPSNANGTLINFALNGNTSNFVCSQIPLLYPNYGELELNIGEYPPPHNEIQEICSGDPAHFCLSLNGTVPSIPPGTTIQWQQNEGGGWIDITDPAFNGLCFPVNAITTDCSSNPDGFIDRVYRAMITAIDPITGLSCTYLSDADTLRICCPIGPASVLITPDDPLCEGDTTDVDVQLISSDPFVLTPGPFVMIEWFVNGANIPGASNQTHFSFTYNSVTPPSLCFEAVITNCGGKESRVSSCVVVDPVPECGTIEGKSPSTLTQDPFNPDLYYICPGNDGVIGIADTFKNCIINWQYSFDLGVWPPLGISNGLQNTNILPSSLWPTGVTSIFYRIECKPLSDPSGCEPCYSNILEIQLIEPPIMDVITGLNRICKEDGGTLLSVSSPDPDLDYTWLCNGLEVGTGPDYFATEAACYWVEISNGCQVVETGWFCLEICEIIPIITCPLPPNPCAVFTEPITISACDSKSTCGDNSLFTYEWSWLDANGDPQTATGCTLTDTPPKEGTEYFLTIKDGNTGCEITTSTFIKPCC